MLHFYLAKYQQKLSIMAKGPEISIFFFALDGKFPGAGTFELSNSPGWGRKKRANTPSSINTVTFFIDRTVVE